MKVFIDFEANDLPQVPEIISIGAVAETGQTFYTVVKPHFRLTHNIMYLTGISQKDVNEAPSIDAAILGFWTWITALPNNDKIEYITYGDRDFEYLECSRDFCKRLDVREIINNIISSMFHIERDLFAEKPLKLYNVYTKLREKDSSLPNFVSHNALNDALMLKTVFEHRKEISTWKTMDSGGGQPTANA